MIKAGIIIAIRILFSLNLFFRKSRPNPAKRAIARLKRTKALWADDDLMPKRLYCQRKIENIVGKEINNVIINNDIENITSFFFLTKKIPNNARVKAVTPTNPVLEV